MICLVVSLYGCMLPYEGIIIQVHFIHIHIIVLLTHTHTLILCRYIHLYKGVEETDMEITEAKSRSLMKSNTVT